MAKIPMGSPLSWDWVDWPPALTGTLDCNGHALQNRALEPGDVVLTPMLTSEDPSNTTYARYKEIRTGVAGTLRVKFYLYASYAGHTIYGQVYKNGVPYGVERSVTWLEGYESSEDLVFAAGDLIQLYLKVSGAKSGTTTAGGFKVCAAEGESFPITLD